ncbi:AUX/IAA protein [Macleaya cordata]|uniref:Auxin-responsive protein n=1 Tax=Macleaya cordata TaxID=56857 RepID=A0A200PNT0_MACCD|nr:AUX/IAA protein [Macleaya cordata]
MSIRLGFDLNNQIYEPKDNFGSETSTWSTSSNYTDGTYLESNKNKRRFDKAFDDDQNTNSSSSIETQKTLPLLSWNDQPNEEEEDDDHLNRSIKRNCYTMNNQVEEEASSVVGWPPVKSWMKKKLHQHYHNPHNQHHHDHDQDGCVDDEDHRREGNGNGNGNGSGASNSKYVKVMMEGMPIGRKVDLSVHQSYQTLTTTLINMFGKYNEKGVKGLKDGTRYTLTYQDKEGDWLLVGDVPWQTFIRSVQRLKILREGC